MKKQYFSCENKLHECNHNVNLIHIKKATENKKEKGKLFSLLQVNFMFRANVEKRKNESNFFCHPTKNQF